MAIYGGIRSDLAWRAPELECSGMPRPNGAGARLRFAGAIDPERDAGRLAFIIALPELARGGTVSETPANVTVIQEDSGRFFSSTDTPICWSDVAEQRLIAGNEYSIRGIVYCVSPLAELNGAAGVSFTDLEFSGRIDWEGGT